jgi:hypothetical protein
MPDFTKKPSFFAFKDWTAAASRRCFPAFITLEAPTIQPNGRARLQIQADPQFTYTVQGSTDFGQWQNLVTNLSGTNGMFTFEDVDGVAPAQRFYRATWP